MTERASVSWQPRALGNPNPNLTKTAASVVFHHWPLLCLAHCRLCTTALLEVVIGLTASAVPQTQGRSLLVSGCKCDPIESSRADTKSRPWMELIELEHDHALAHVADEIWDAVRSFCGL